MAVAAAKKSTSYKVIASKNKRQFEVQAFGMTKNQARAEVDRQFGWYGWAQVAIYNEATARVVARYEQDYDSAKGCWIVKQTGTR